MNAFKKTAWVIALAASSFAAIAGGNVVVINETDDAIHPFFRYNCWGDPIFSQIAGANGWVFFGGIGPRGSFGWGFNDPALTDPNCKNPKLEFTYTTDPDVSQPAAQPAVYRKMQFDPLTNFYLQNGERIRSYNLLSPDGN
jgi:hypothetical protein